MTEAASEKKLVRWPRSDRGWMILGTLLLAAAAAICIWGAALGLGGWVIGYRLEYIAVVALIVFWMMAAGKAFNGRVEGLLIDGRNRISLSRLQLFVWLVIVGCAFAVEVAHNFHVKAPDPGGVTVPKELGLVMGLATTSFVASPAILSLKVRSGRLQRHRSGDDARWSDLFRGEEPGIARSADPAKVQQFLVTFMLAVIYLAALWRDLAGPVSDAALGGLPGIGEGGLVLLGVSHAAYLGSKAAPQTPQGTPNVSTAPQPPAASTKPPP
jgi:hypothetical protein